MGLGTIFMEMLHNARSIEKIAENVRRCGEYPSNWSTEKLIEEADPENASAAQTVYKRQNTLKKYLNYRYPPIEL